jgi:hypothetical protein
MIVTMMLAQDVSESLMDTEVKLKVRDLLAVSSDVRQNIKYQLTGKRQAVETNGMNLGGSKSSLEQSQL